MAFGRIMRVNAGDIKLELAPLVREDMPQYVTAGGMQYHSVTQYLNQHPAPTEADEYDWFDKERADKASVTWGIYDISDDHRILIGSTSLGTIEGTIIRQATSGILIFRKDYWGKGIASAAHLARTKYAFEQLGLHRIKSAVIIGNDASYKALHRVGYEQVYVERNTVFVNGKLRHQRNLELLNPNNPFWSTWWGTDKPTDKARAARQRTRDALEKASNLVTLP